MVMNYERDDAQSYSNIFEKLLVFIVSELGYILTKLRVYDPEWREYDAPMVDWRKLLVVLSGTAVSSAFIGSLILAAFLYIAGIVHLFPLIVYVVSVSFTWFVAIGYEIQSLILSAIPVICWYSSKFVFTIYNEIEDVL